MASSAIPSLPPFVWGSGLSAGPPEPKARPLKRLGIGMHSYGNHWTAARQGHPRARFHDPITFLEYAGEIEAGGVQTAIGVRDAAYTGKLRARAEALGLYVEAQASPPHDKSDLERFEAEVRSARAAGAAVLRVAFLRGRRYETFDSAGGFQRFAQRAWNSLVLSEPILRKHRMRLAIENHKDWLIEELLGLIEKISSEWVGVLVDTGNSIALLEDPMEVIEAYAPWAVSTHLKDMGLLEWEEGFLLSEVPLGEGFLDLPAIISTLERANPAIQWNLEMITRDPLKVPCLTERYWAALPRLPASRLARMLALVRNKAGDAPLPHVTGLSPAERLEIEDRNVRSSLVHAQTSLNL